MIPSSTLLMCVFCFGAWRGWLETRNQSAQHQQPSQPITHHNSLIINNKANQSNQANTTIISVCIYHHIILHDDDMIFSNIRLWEKSGLGWCGDKP
jgi:hypothetical protein